MFVYQMLFSVPYGKSNSSVHCHYNPIELVWCQVKRAVAKNSRTVTVAKIVRLMNEKLDRVTQEDWALSCVYMMQADPHESSRRNARSDVHTG
jgi:hypothetical protein